MITRYAGRLTTEREAYGGVRRHWLAAWAGLAALGVANGLSRGLYADRLGEHRAHQLSSVTLVTALLPYAAAVERRRPIGDAGTAVEVGLAWTALTIAFEFGFGRLVARQSWSDLLADYDLRRGRLWPLVLVGVAAAPSIARATHRGPSAS